MHEENTRLKAKIDKLQNELIEMQEKQASQCKKIYSHKNLTEDLEKKFRMSPESTRNFCDPAYYL